MGTSKTLRLRLCEMSSPWHQRVMTGPSPLILSVLVIAAFLLAAGGVHLVVRRRERGKGALMLLAAAVALGDVLIWAL
jgi:hypothetical protein